MKKIYHKVLSILTCITLLLGLFPVQVHAGWDDGVECEYCGGYRFDDWLCECGPHCSETADEVECYFNHHCANCLKSCEERCDECDLCDECAKESEQHCALCEQHDNDICTYCFSCTDCMADEGTHCAGCGACMLSATECPQHPYDIGSTDNHCADCALVCWDCEECMSSDCFNYDEDLYCLECDMCVFCAEDYELHCEYCLACCAEDERCEECGMCLECGLEQLLHCPECEYHVEEWCEQGEEGVHCMDCADQYRCEQCGECSECNELDICLECGLCEVCCRENAESEGCDCGEYCILSMDYLDHCCPDCGICYDETESCEYCELCIECCETYTDCSEGMCVENPDYENHFCQDCDQCFHDVTQCESCEESLEYFCQECCEAISYSLGCEHGYCNKSWEWREHFCEICNCCYGTGFCEHSPKKHRHIYDSVDRCTICGISRDGKPYVKSHPESVDCVVTDLAGENPEENCVTFAVKALGDNLQYVWMMQKDDEGAVALEDQLSSGYEDCIAYSGSKTNELTVWIEPDACNHEYQFFCIVKNAKGEVTSEKAAMNVDHAYKESEAVLGERAWFMYYDVEAGNKSTIVYQESSGHVKICAGEGCEMKSEQTPHRYGNWIPGALPTKAYVGYKYRECVDCGYVNYSVILYVEEPHKHDFSYACVFDEESHWWQCKCAEEDKAHKERHTFGEWKVTKDGTILSKGEETRVCSVCGYAETRETERKGHAHVFYDWDYILTNDYLYDEYGEIIWPHQEPYGKTSKQYHYSYCIVEDCTEVKKEEHKMSGKKWITYPTATEDGVFYQECGSCGYEGGGICKASHYPIFAKDCKISKQTAKPGDIIKLTPYEQYKPPYYFNNAYGVLLTVDGGKTRVHIGYEYNREEQYHYFIMPEVPDGVRWDQIWIEVEADMIECGAGHDHNFVWKNEVEATCGTPGYTGDYICEWCNYVEEQGEVIPSTGDHHASLKNVVEASCTVRGYTGDLVCDDCGEVLEKGKRQGYEHKPWFIETTKPRVNPTCNTPGSTVEKSCRNCGTVVERSKTLPKGNHSWKSVEGTPSTCQSNGTKFHYECYMCGTYSYDKETVFTNEVKLFNYTRAGHQWSVADDGVSKNCSVCGVSQRVEKDSKTRLYGKTRYETSYAIADALKKQLGLDRFSNVIIANGKNFPDALAGSYLANKRQAPILMASEKNAESLAQYLEANLIPGGKIYVLGGAAAVADSILEGLKEHYQIKRLAGANRYETNLEILKEAGVGAEEILICTGKGFADSLSVSATGKPILLVGKTLNEEQKAFLDTVRRNQFYIIGGEGAVSSTIETELKAYGGSIRISGASRYDTSIAVAEEFFDIPAAAVLAYAKNFPDGLCGGPLAYSKHTPLILTADGKQNAAVSYAKNKGIGFGTILGGDSLISDTTANEILGEK